MYLASVCFESTTLDKRRRTGAWVPPGLCPALRCGDEVWERYHFGVLGNSSLYCKGPKGQRRKLGRRLGEVLGNPRSGTRQ